MGILEKIANVAARPAKCEKCGTWPPGHRDWCSTLNKTPEEWSKLAQWYEQQMRGAQSRTIRMRELLSVWEGKFRILRHENNRLRRANDGRTHLPDVVIDIQSVLEKAASRGKATPDDLRRILRHIQVGK